MQPEKTRTEQPKIIRVEAYDDDVSGITLESGHTILLELGHRIREPAFAALVQSGSFCNPRTDGRKIYWADGTFITLEEILKMLLFC